MNSSLTRIAVALAILVATPVVAHAQIYTWRDAAAIWCCPIGRRTAAARTFAVSSGDTVLTTRPVGSRRRPRTTG